MLGSPSPDCLSNKLRDELLEHEIAASFGKPAGQENDGVGSQRTSLLGLVFGHLLLKEDRIRLVVSNVSVSESFVLVSVHQGQVTMFRFLQTSNETDVILCSAFLFFCFLIFLLLFFLVFYFFNFKIFNSYVHSQT